MQIHTEALGHTFHILPGVRYSLGHSLGEGDGTFAIQWQDDSITTYRVVSLLEDMSYEVQQIPAEECTADLSNFTPFFSERLDDDGYPLAHDGSVYDEEDDYDDWDDSDGLSDAEADSMTLASAGWGTDEDYGYYGGDEW